MNKKSKNLLTAQKARIDEVMDVLIDLVDREADALNCVIIEQPESDACKAIDATMKKLGDILTTLDGVQSSIDQVVA